MPRTAGGANTNKNGLAFERKTVLYDQFSSHEKKTVNRREYPDEKKERFLSKARPRKGLKYNYEKVVFKCNDEVYELVSGANFPKRMRDITTVSDVEALHGCKHPDEVYIHEQTKKLFIVEKKTQQIAGSVYEKLQSAGVKRINYKRQYPEYSIEYIFCLSDFFRGKCPGEMELLEEHNIPVFWGDREDYGEDLCAYIASKTCI